MMIRVPVGGMVIINNLKYNKYLKAFRHWLFNLTAVDDMHADVPSRSEDPFGSYYLLLTPFPASSIADKASRCMMNGK